MLLVEDETLLARTFKRTFRKDYLVIHFTTVKGAREYLKENIPDVALLDRQVEFEDGWSLREELLPQVRVVLMTGAPPDHNNLPFFHKGVDDIQYLIDLVKGE